MKNKIDWILLGTIVILVFFGLIMVYSASAIFSENLFDNDPFHIFKNQLTWTILGLIIMIIAIFIPTRLIDRLGWPLLILSLILLTLVFIPNIGVKTLGARRWIKFWFLSFQPSELAKLSVIIIMAKFLKDEQKVENLKEGFFPVLGILLFFSGIIVIEPDFGTAAMIFALGLILMFIAGIRFVYLLNLSAISAPVAVILVLLAGYRKERILAFLDPNSLSSTSGYQIIQSKIAIGSGGIAGLGLGNSMQKLFFLPQAHSDYIFSIIGEELGFIGAVFLLGLFILLMLRGYKIAGESKNRFAKLVAYGITFHIILQTILNLGITLGLLPPKGLPLPFFSAGGSSLIITLLEIGILLRISLENETGKQYGL